METIENKESDFKDIEDRIKQLDSLRGMQQTEAVDYVTGRVYRVEKKPKAGKSSRECAGVVDDIVTDEEIGELFGSGTFLVAYSFYLNDGKTVIKNVYYYIGKEFDSIHKQYLISSNPQPQTSQLNGLLSSLDPEKITVIFALLKTLKDFFQPSQSTALDIKDILPLIAANKPSDMVLIEAMKTAKESKTMPSNSLSGLSDLKETFVTLKDLFSSSDSTQKVKPDMTEMILESLIQYLPQLLSASPREVEQVASDNKENFLVKKILKDPDLVKTLIEKISNKYGREKAIAIAKGLGFNAEFKGVSE